ncbi:GNAT family N-acetyltransferase [Rothia terrae]|uniref:GNAT family N-acetyltransferase n=1 Tax=Rothia terrae TaxID=396015 RepID=UPI001446BD7D|nr:GNAT family N-acetyltransferase [Rothia terrae]NKZ33574.1 GNAT family N-acetyltransferase [Rothia terrae]
MQATEVTITYLQMLERDEAQVPSSLPAGVKIERAAHASPELARWLYATVGGPWYWYERLGWDREKWQEELDEVGSEIWLLTVDGTPAGYCQLAAHIESSSGRISAETEILYFGLMEFAQGKGLGKIFLQQMIVNAWTLAERHPLPSIGRVWVHTCTLDGPYALANYEARGLTSYGSSTENVCLPAESLGSWQAMFATAPHSNLSDETHPSAG